MSSTLNESSDGDATPSQYPFGLSSRQLFVFVVIIGLLGPGLVVYTLEQGNYSGLADFVWIVGYGTTVFVVWYIWIRPLDFVSPAGLDLEADEGETSGDDEDD